MPRKRADGKEQINSWVDSELASDIRGIQEQLGLANTSDAVKYLLQLAVEKYGINNSPITADRTGALGADRPSCPE